MAPTPGTVTVAVGASEMTVNPYASQPWRTMAACAGMDPNQFVPEGRGNGGLLYIEARQICDRCPVKAECLEYALQNGEEWGMWGGTTPNERKELGYIRQGICKICGCRFRRHSNKQQLCSDACRVRNGDRTRRSVTPDVSNDVERNEIT